MDFSDALRELRHGKRMRRGEWPDGTFIVRVPGTLIVIPQSAPAREFMPLAADLACRGYIVLHASQGVWMPGWSCDQIEMFAEDWEVLEEAA